MGSRKQRSVRLPAVPAHLPSLAEPPWQPPLPAAPRRGIRHWRARLCVCARSAARPCRPLPAGLCYTAPAGAGDRHPRHVGLGARLQGGPAGPGGRYEASLACLFQAVHCPVAEGVQGTASHRPVGSMLASHQIKPACHAGHRRSWRAPPSHPCCRHRGGFGPWGGAPARGASRGCGQPRRGGGTCSRGQSGSGLGCRLCRRVRPLPASAGSRALSTAG